MEQQNSENPGARQNNQDAERENLEQMLEDLKSRLMAEKCYENLVVRSGDSNTGRFYSFSLNQITPGGWFKRAEEKPLLTVDGIFNGGGFGERYLLAHFIDSDIRDVVKKHLEEYREEQGLTAVHYH